MIQGYTYLDYRKKKNYLKQAPYICRIVFWFSGRGFPFHMLLSFPLQCFFFFQFPDIARVASIPRQISI